MLKTAMKSDLLCQMEAKCEKRERSRVLGPDTDSNITHASLQITTLCKKVLRFGTGQIRSIHFLQFCQFVGRKISLLSSEAKISTLLRFCLLDCIP